MTQTTDNLCPKCGAPLSEVTTTSTGRELQRCSKGSWDPQLKKVIGCDYVKWLEIKPVTLDEKCPKCGAPLVLQSTRFGKKMKRCSNSSLDKETKQNTGCDYIEWINGTTENLDEKCPKCGEKLVLDTTTRGKKMKKRSTSRWDKEKKQATGCDYIEWINNYPSSVDTGEEFLP